MALLVTQPATPAGTTPNYVAAAAGGDSLSPSDDTMLIVKNGGGSSVTVTVASPTPCSQGSTHPLVVTVPAAGERHIGPLGAARYASATTGLVNVTYSAVTSVTVAVVQA